MTNPSLPKTSDTPKISDLVAPAEQGRVRVGTGLPDHGPSPAAQRFDQVLQTVAKRSTPDRAASARPGPERKEFGPPARPAPSRSEVRQNKSPARRPDGVDERDRSDAAATSDGPDEAGKLDDDPKAVERDETDDGAGSHDQPADEESAASTDEDSASDEAESNEADSTSGDAAKPAAGVAADLVLAASAETTDVTGNETVEESAEGRSVGVLDGVSAVPDQEAEQADEVDLTSDLPASVANVHAPVIADEAPVEEVASEEAAEAIEAAETGAENSDADGDVEISTTEDGGGDGGGSADADADADVEAELADQEQGADAQADSDGGEAPSQPRATVESSGSAPQSAIGTQPAVNANGLAAAAAAVTGAVAEVGTATTTATTAGTGQAAGAGQAVDGEDGDLLWRQVRRAIGSIRTNTIGEQQMTIRLRPAELGSVMVRISTGEAGTTVALVTESAAAASQLTQQRQQLISELEEGGLSDVAVDVGTSDEAQQDQTDESDGDVEAGDGTGRSTIGGVGQDGQPIDRFRSQRVSGAQARLVDVDL